MDESNISELHASYMAYDRLRKYLKLENMPDEEVLDFCKNIVLNKENKVSSGKNDYYYKGNVILTIHRNSKSIITGKLTK